MLRLDGKDKDGVVLTDGTEDRCYIYFEEIPDTVQLLRDAYYHWRNPE